MEQKEKRWRGDPFLPAAQNTFYVFNQTRKAIQRPVDTPLDRVIDNSCFRHKQGRNGPSEGGL